MGSGSFSDQSNRIVWHQKNTIRVGDSDDANSAPAAVVNVPNDWRTALASVVTQ